MSPVRTAPARALSCARLRRCGDRHEPDADCGRLCEFRDVRDPGRASDRATLADRTASLRGLCCGMEGLRRQPGAGLAGSSADRHLERRNRQAFGRRHISPAHGWLVVLYLPGNSGHSGRSLQILVPPIGTPHTIPVGDAFFSPQRGSRNVSHRSQALLVPWSAQRGLLSGFCGTVQRPAGTVWCTVRHLHSRDCHPYQLAHPDGPCRHLGQ